MIENAVASVSSPDAFIHCYARSLDSFREPSDADRAPVLHRPLPSAEQFPNSGQSVLWEKIRVTAHDIGFQEPLLRPLLNKLIFSRSSLQEAAVAMIARKLRHEDMPEAALADLASEVLLGNDDFARTFHADLMAVCNRDPACPHPLHVLLNLKGFQALQIYRLFHALWQQERRELAFYISNLASAMFSIDIHPAARIGKGVMLDHGTGIVIGETTVIDDNVSLLQNVTLGGTGKEHGDRHPKIQSGVMVGAGAKILGNIVIGTMSKVAAGSVVLQDVPPHCTVAGVPARVVRTVSTSTCPSQEMDQTV